MSGTGLKAVFGRALDKIINLFCDTTELIAEELKKKPAMPDFDGWIKGIRTAVGRVILEQEKKKKTSISK